MNITMNKSSMDYQQYDDYMIEEDPVEDVDDSVTLINLCYEATDLANVPSSQAIELFNQVIQIFVYSFSMSLEKLLSSCQLADGSDDTNKGDQLLEIYALYIHIEDARQNYKKLRDIYHRALRINEVCNLELMVLSMNVVAKCIYEHHSNANTSFIEAPRCFDEVGARDQCINCLKYLVVANMLTGSNINPFDEPESLF